jgi:hypothetical protein
MASPPQPMYVITVDSTPEKASQILAGLIKVCAITTRVLVPVTNLLKAVEKDYSLVHVANCEGEHYTCFPQHKLTPNLSAIKDIKPVLSSLVLAPQVLVEPLILILSLENAADGMKICSSKLFDDEEEEVREIAQRLLPDIILIMVPHDLHESEGGKAVVEFLVEQITESRLPTRA